jgi:lysine decarboxylase
VVPEQVLAPREAFFAPVETVPADAAAGRVSAELVAPYPPGVPVLAPGERITAAALDALHAARSDGARIAYAADPTLATLAVVAA